MGLGCGGYDQSVMPGILRGCLGRVDLGVGVVDATRGWSRFGNVKFALIGGVCGPDPGDLVVLQGQESGGEEGRAEESRGGEGREYGIHLLMEGCFGRLVY